MRPLFAAKFGWALRRKDSRPRTYMLLGFSNFLPRRNYNFHTSSGIHHLQQKEDRSDADRCGTLSQNGYGNHWKPQSLYSVRVYVFWRKKCKKKRGTAREIACDAPSILADFRVPENRYSASTAVLKICQNLLKIQGRTNRRNTAKASVDRNTKITLILTTAGWN